MTANINDLIFEKLDPVYGTGLDVAELLVAWWADNDGSGYPVGDALYDFYGGTLENFADRQYDYWTNFSTSGTFTLYATAADGRIASTSATYATAAAGGTLGVSSASLPAGQIVSGGTYACYESFLAFDTSSVTGTIESVTLSLYGASDVSGTDFIVEARAHDWGGTVEVADFVAAADLGAATLLASFDTAGFVATGYNDFTSEAEFAANINLSGETRFLLCSSRHRSGTAPTGAEYVTFKPSETADTTQDPKLVIVTT